MKVATVSNATRVTLVIGICLLTSSCMAAKATPSSLGRRVSSFYGTPNKPLRLDGELIAVGRDTLWVRGEAGVMRLPLADVQRVRMERHALTPARGFRWAMILGVATGAALSISCSNYHAQEGDSGSCGKMFTNTVLISAVVGGFFSVPLSSSAYQTTVAPNWNELTPFARFPQGLPQLPQQMLLDEGDLVRRETLNWPPPWPTP